MIEDENLSYEQKMELLQSVLQYFSHSSKSDSNVYSEIGEYKIQKEEKWKEEMGKYVKEHYRLL